jgi:hypothetical protein
LKNSFGLTIEQYEEMVERQGGLCALCGQAGVGLCVDHDHETGQIRGLLCGKCNKGLGLFGDSAEGLIRALRYLERTP